MPQAEGRVDISPEVPAPNAELAGTEGAPVMDTSGLYTRRQMSSILHALNVALEAHLYQEDKQGVPYIAHVMAVTTTLLRQARAAHVVAAGALHDVMEDCDYTADDLRERGISEHTILLVDLLTHQPNEGYWEYIERLVGVGPAVAVKLADIADNLGRVDQIDDPKTRERLTHKYSRALTMLGARNDSNAPTSDGGT